MERTANDTVQARSDPLNVLMKWSSNRSRVARSRLLSGASSDALRSSADGAIAAITCQPSPVSHQFRRLPWLGSGSRQARQQGAVPWQPVDRDVEPA